MSAVSRADHLLDLAEGRSGSDRASVQAISSPWMTVAEAAVYAREGEDSIREVLASAELVGYQRKPGGRWRIHRDDLDRYLRNDVGAAQPPRVARGRAAS